MALGLAWRAQRRDHLGFKLCVRASAGFAHRLPCASDFHGVNSLNTCNAKLVGLLGCSTFEGRQKAPHLDNRPRASTLAAFVVQGLSVSCCGGRTAKKTE